jgi:diaminopimelate decarboxylase
MRPPWEVPGFLEQRSGILQIDGVSTAKIAERHGTPVFVYSEARIRSNIARISAASDKIPIDLKICYAAKAMSTLGILRAVRVGGADVEVNSGGELWKARKAGFEPNQIIFNGTSKEQWELEMAINAGVYAIQADSLFEISLIEKVAGDLGHRANVSLRLVPDIGSDTHSGLQTALLTSKFGMMPSEALEAIGKYRDSSAIDICGLHLHIGSQNPDLEVYAEALVALVGFLTQAKAAGADIRHLNIGGGFPVNYLPAAKPDVAAGQRELLSAGYTPAKAIENAFQELADANLSGITLVTEPGRSIIADAGVCLTTVRNAKQRPVDRWLLTDAGFNILLSMETYKWYYHLISATRAGEPHDTEFRVAGPLCDGGDVYFDIEGEGRLPDHRDLPAGTAAGDVLALLNCGAYSMSQASQYNGRALPAVVLVTTKGEPKLIRRRDNLEDLIANEL